MNDLRADLDQLKEVELDYVLARSEVSSDSDGYKDASIGKSTFYKWPRKIRDHLNDLALKLKRTTALRAKMILSEATQKAAEVKVKGMDSRNEHIKQSASTEILDRMLGKATQKTEISGPKGRPIEIVEIIKDNGTLPTE